MITPGAGPPLEYNIQKSHYMASRQMYHDQVQIQKYSMHGVSERVLYYTEPWGGDPDGWTMGIKVLG